MTTDPCGEGEGLVVERDRHRRRGRLERSDGGSGRRLRVGRHPVAREPIGRRIARGERVDLCPIVCPVAVGDAEGGEGIDERVLRTAEGYAILRAPWTGEAGLDVSEIELDDL